MDKSKIYDLLYQRSLALDKRINRLLLFLYVFPLIYFLIDNALISDVKTPLISVAKIDAILIVFPVIYSISILMIFVFFNRATDIYYQLSDFDIDYPEFTVEIKRLLRPIIFINDIFHKKFFTKSLVDFLMELFIYIPIAILSIGSPILFFGYIIYKNCIYKGDYKTLAIWSSIIGIWILAVAIFRTIVLVKNDKKKIEK